MASKNFNDPNKVLKYHVRIKGFSSVEEFETLFDEFDKERKKHKKGSKKRKDLDKWQDLDGTKKGLKKVMDKK